VYLPAHHPFYPTIRAEGLHLSAQTPLPGFFASEAPKGDVLQKACPIGTPHRGDFQAHTNLLCLFHLSIDGNMQFNNRLFTLTAFGRVGQSVNTLTVTVNWVITKNFRKFATK
jgi:hypothetical protein